MTSFGEYQFGNEVLFIPDLEKGFGQHRGMEQPRPTVAQHEKSQECAADLERRKYWFRWVTGHQSMLLLWHLLAAELSAFNSDDQITPDLELSAKIFRATASIYEYSCFLPVEFYNRDVRPFMSLSHMGFSGSWAADYRYLSLLCSMVMNAPRGVFDAGSLKIFKESRSMGHKSHVTVANRMVPGGGSLLKKSAETGCDFVRPLRHHYLIFDSFFQVHRTSVTADQLVDSLDMRIDAILVDLNQGDARGEDFFSVDPVRVIDEARVSIKQSRGSAFKGNIREAVEREVRSAHELLRLFDTNRDGAITRAEAGDIYAKRFQQWDKDGDGIATREEIEEFLLDMTTWQS